MLGAQPAARAGSDVFGNVSPAAEVPDGLAERYPLGNYALDQHFTAVDASLTGGVDASGVPPMIAHFLANALWQLTAFLADALITLFTFAFSLDLVRGSEATGGTGALAPVGRAIRALYSDVLGQPWLVAAMAIVGVWAMWRALVQRRYTETAGALGLSLVYLVLALAFVTQPERTVGEASRWTNQVSVAFLSLAREGDLASEHEAKRAASDQLFGLLVFEPWTVLQFGGREHCVRNGTGSEDKDPESVAVRPLARDPGRDAALARALARGTDVAAEDKTCVSNRNKYAPHFLRFAPGSDERDAEYEALNSGDASKLPDADPSKARGDYRLGVADKPATDAMEKGGQYQRLLVALVVFAGELGAFLLLGALALGIILAQVLLLLLLAFAPVALVLGVIPGRGHDFFRGWLVRIAGFLVRKAAYSLVLTLLLAVNAALAEASSNLGWLMSFGLQGLFFWSVFLYRHQLTGQLLAATAGSEAARQEGSRRLANVYYATRLANRPLRGLRQRAGRARRAVTGGARTGLGSLREAGTDAIARRREDARRADARDADDGARAETARRPGEPPAPERERPARPADPGVDPGTAGRSGGESGLVDDLRADRERLDAPRVREHEDRGHGGSDDSPPSEGARS
jgi:hypothetical protein